MNSRLPRLLVPVLLVMFSVTGVSCGAGDVDGDPADASSEDASDASSETGGDPSIEADEPEAVELPAWPDGRYIEPEEVFLRLTHDDPDMLPLLVSDEEFWDMGMIEGSVVIPWDLLEGRTGEVDPSRHVVIYCRRGVRSESGHDTLDTAGYEHIWVMGGGLEDWIDVLGYPVVSVPRGRTSKPSWRKSSSSARATSIPSLLISTNDVQSVKL